MKDEAANTLILVFGVLALGLGGYFVYTKYFKQSKMQNKPAILSDNEARIVQLEQEAQDWDYKASISVDSRKKAEYIGYANKARQQIIELKNG